MWPHPPHSHVATRCVFIGDLAFINVKLCGHQACIGGPTFADTWCVLEARRFLEVSI